MIRFRLALRAYSLAAVMAVFAAPALAQLAPERTWPELKEAVQQRADRNAYPMTGMKPEDVREILSGISSLDRDEWAASWTKMGARYAAQAASLAATDKKAAHEAYMMAHRYDSFGGWPTPNSPGKKQAFLRGVDDFRKASALSDPPLEPVSFPFDGKTVNAYLALPKDARQSGARPVPVVLTIGGLDSYKEYWGERVEQFLKAGVGVLCLDMPGTGESPIKIDVGAEKVFSAAIDYLLTRGEVDGRRLAVIGASWGGYWGATLGITEKDRLRGAVVWGGPVHTYFQRDWQTKALGTREYLFDLFAARASVYRVSTLDDFLAYGPRMSLEARGFIGKPSTRMLLINGVNDSQVPIDDLYLLQRSGTAKEAWVNPQGGHMGRGPGWPDGKVFSSIALPWVVNLLKSDAE